MLVRLFEDRNADGRQQNDEPGLPGLVVRVNGQTETSDALGMIETTAVEGRNTIELELGAAADLVVEEAARSITVPAVRLFETTIAVRPAGRLSGTIRLERNGGRPMAGIRFTATRGNASFEALSDEEGAFRFGILPVGMYSVAVDRSTLPEEVTLISPEAIQIEVGRGERREVEFRARRMSARERLLGAALPAPPPRDDRAQRLARAVALAQEGRFRDAHEAFQTVMPLTASENSERYSYAFVLYELGEYGAAKRELRLALPHIEITPEVERYRMKIEGAIEWKGEPGKP
jgi:hypothetical protein